MNAAGAARRAFFDSGERFIRLPTSYIGIVSARIVFDASCRLK
jgi:hypothetical protein